MKAAKRNEVQDNITDEQYEKLRKHLMEKSSNRMYATWTNPKKNKECKQIQAGTKCFCDHDYKNHEYLHPQDKNKVHCKVKNCPCRHYSYVPSQGNMDFKCNCKHSHKLHDPISRRCTFLNCGGCNRGFQTNFVCQLCNTPFGEHVLIFETRRERQEQGKIVNDPGDNFNYEKYDLMMKEQKAQQPSRNSQGSIGLSDKDSFIKIEENILFQSNPSYQQSNEPITDAEIMRRKGIPLQIHMYNSQGRYEKSGQKYETIRDEDETTKSDKIQISQDWNLKTMVLEENGRQINAKKQLEEQLRDQEFKNTKFKQKGDYEEYLKEQGRKGTLLRLNQQLKEERKQLQQKYGHKPIDDENEMKNLQEEFPIEEDKEIIGEVSAYYLYNLPNKYSFEIKRRIFQQDILDRLVEEY